MPFSLRCWRRTQIQYFLRQLDCWSLPPVWFYSESASSASITGRFEPGHLCICSWPTVLHRSQRGVRLRGLRQTRGCLSGVRRSRARGGTCSPGGRRRLQLSRSIWAACLERYRIDRWRGHCLLLRIVGLVRSFWTGRILVGRGGRGRSQPD